MKVIRYMGHRVAGKRWIIYLAQKYFLNCIIKNELEYFVIIIAGYA